MKSKLIKAFVILLMMAGVVGLVIYEEWSIVTKEHERQLEIAQEDETEIKLGLDMLKIAVQTEDTELYGANLARVRAAMAEIGSLAMVQDEYGEYLGKLGEYAGLLEDRAEMLAEMHELKGAVDGISDTLGAEYGNKDEISKDKVRGAKEKIGGLKIDAGKYGVEKVALAVNSVNDVLDKLMGKVGELSDCIDNCYKDKIKSLNDGLAELLKEFLDKAPGVNAELENEFELARMEELKKGV